MMLSSGMQQRLPISPTGVAMLGAGTVCFVSRVLLMKQPAPNKQQEKDGIFLLQRHSDRPKKNSD